MLAEKKLSEEIDRYKYVESTYDVIVVNLEKQPKFKARVCKKEHMKKPGLPTADRSRVGYLLVWRGFSSYSVSFEPSSGSVAI